jgi:hypothetical protein
MGNAYPEDPFLDEIHKTRERLLEECGGDIEKLMDRLQAREQGDHARVVRDLKPFKVPAGSRS